MTEVVGNKIIARGGNPKRTFLKLHELTVAKDGVERPYFAVTRGDTEAILSPKDKRPDAVVIVGVIEGPDRVNRLVTTSEFRPAIGGREIGFPAGLIDPADYAAGGTMNEIATRAAKREFMEEVGLELHVTRHSPPNLYSSAGMTNESVIVVFGTATGTPTVEHNEGGEDIQINLMTLSDINQLVYGHACDPAVGIGKVAWPLMWVCSLRGLSQQ